MELVKKAEERLQEARVRSDLLKRSLKDREEINTSWDATKQAVAILQQVGELVKKQATEETEKLVTSSLQEAFPEEDLSFRIDQETKRGQSGIAFKLIDNAKGVEGSPLESFGGGPAALIGVVLRVMSILRQPSMKRFILLDEPIVQVSREYEAGVAKILRKLCEPEDQGGLGFDMLVVTHSSTLISEAHTSYVASNQGFLTLEKKDSNGR